MQDASYARDLWSSIPRDIFLAVLDRLDSKARCEAEELMELKNDEGTTGEIIPCHIPEKLYLFLALRGRGCRVRDTVLVCKHWSSLCLQNAPRVSELEVQLKKDCSPSYLHWIAKLGASVRCVEIDVGVYLPRSLTSQTIGCLAFRHPHLRKLLIR